MKPSFALLMSGALIVSAGMAQAANDRSPDEQLAKALSGRVAGKPVDCIPQQNIQSSRIIDNTAILYEMAGGTIYVNRPTSGASSLKSDLTLVTDTHTSQLCNVDIVRLYDSTARMPSGTVGLGAFVPYPRPERAAGR